MRAGLEEGGGLCCCEYWGEAGERQHLLGLCCDCEAVDRAGDALLTGGSVDTQTVRQILDTVEDRLRLPWRGGAVRIPLGWVLPVILGITQISCDGSTKLSNTSFL